MPCSVEIGGNQAETWGHIVCTADREALFPALRDSHRQWRPLRRVVEPGCTNDDRAVGVLRTDQPGIPVRAALRRERVDAVIAACCRVPTHGKSGVAERKAHVAIAE